jgi:hypothetical protein
MTKAVKSPPASPARANHETFTKLQYTCTETGEPSVYEVRADAATLKDLWSRTLPVTCAQCRQIHQVPFRQAYVQAVIAGAAPVWLEGLDSAGG